MRTGRGAGAGVAVRVWERKKIPGKSASFPMKKRKSPCSPIVILIPPFIMQNLPIVKEFRMVSGEISILHNRGGPTVDFCGL